METMCDPDALYRAIIRATENSKWKESTHRFLQNYLSELFKLERELKTMTYRTGPHAVFETSERGKIRTISSLITRDRVVRHVLCDDVLLPSIQKKLIHDNGASLPGKGISFTRRRFEQHLHEFWRIHGSDGYILFGDYSKFYDNILHRIAKEQLLDLYDHDEYLKWLLDVIFSDFELDVGYMTKEDYANQEHILFSSHEHQKMIASCDPSIFDGTQLLHKSVGIGDQVSQIIGIFYPTAVDNYVKTVRGQRFYGRYMDDWYLMSTDKELLWDILDGVREQSSRLGMFVNEKKTGIQKMSSTLTFLQIRYQLTDSGHLIRRMNPKRTTAMRRKIKKLASMVYSGDVELEEVDNMFRSWVGSFHSVLSKQTLSNLFSLYEKLYSCTINVTDNKMVIERRCPPKWITTTIST